jgi:hypothetical protein
LTQNILAKPTPSQALLPFNIPNIDGFFPGFATGDFAILHGLPTVLPLSLLLCVRAQLPIQLGGLETNVVFVDGGNTFRLYKVSHIGQLHELDPSEVLRRIFISRAFTAHQMTSMILDKLEEVALKYDAKLVIVSDIAGLYLNKDVQAEESREVFSQVAARLSKLAEENSLIVIATYLPHYRSRLNAFLHAAACARASVVMSVTKSPRRFGQQLVLEKHPLFRLGQIDFPSEDLTLDHFTGGGA